MVVAINHVPTSMLSTVTHGVYNVWEFISKKFMCKKIVKTKIQDPSIFSGSLPNLTFNVKRISVNKLTSTPPYIKTTGKEFFRKLHLT